MLLNKDTVVSASEILTAIRKDSLYGTDGRKGYEIYITFIRGTLLIIDYTNKKDRDKDFDQILSEVF